MRFDVITLFPEFIEAASAVGVIGKAVKKGLLEIVTHQLRDHTGKGHHDIDDHPYGGGPGMVMRVEPIYDAVGAVRAKVDKARSVLLTPQGRRFDQNTALRLAEEPGLLIFCGRYEGVDERVRPLFDEELSVGDYVLSGGEAAAVVLIDAVGRLVNGVVGSPNSLEEESFSAGLLEYPQYTRPESFRGHRVPSILLSGDHAKIKKWRQAEARRRTRERRPDLIKDGAED